VIELLLQAERALSMGQPDQAERLYAQAVATDPRNSIAVVGLARVALERADEGEAYRLAREALAIDPENVAAARLARRLEEVHATRGAPAPATPPGPPPAPSLPPPPPAALGYPPMPPGAPEDALPPGAPSGASADAVPPGPVRLADRSRLDRLLRRYRP